jgi:hypothetical protein
MNSPSFTIESTDNGEIDEILGQFSADKYAMTERPSTRGTALREQLIHRQ